MLPALGSIGTLAIPAVAAIAAGGGKLFDKHGKKIAIGIAAYFLYKQIKEQGEKKKQIDTANTIATDSSVQQAAILRNAIKTTGANWLDSWTGGTNEKAIFAIAPKITDWEAVQVAYSNLYGGDSLLVDLQGDLSANDMAKFLALLPIKRTTNKSLIQSLKQWQRSYKPIQRTSVPIPVYNRYITKYRVWSKNPNGTFGGYFVTFKSFTYIGTTTGNSIVMGNERFIEITNASSRIAKSGGKPEFYLKQEWLMQTKPPS